MGNQDVDGLVAQGFEIMRLPVVTQSVRHARVEHALVGKVGSWSNQVDERFAERPQRCAGQAEGRKGYMQADYRGEDERKTEEVDYDNAAVAGFRPQWSPLEGAIEKWLLKNLLTTSVDDAQIVFAVSASVQSL